MLPFLSNVKVNQHISNSQSACLNKSEKEIQSQTFAKRIKKGNLFWRKTLKRINIFLWNWTIIELGSLWELKKLMPGWYTNMLCVHILLPLVHYKKVVTIVQKAYDYYIKLHIFLNHGLSNGSPNKII